MGAISTKSLPLTDLPLPQGTGKLDLRAFVGSSALSTPFVVSLKSREIIPIACWQDHVFEDADMSTSATNIMRRRGHDVRQIILPTNPSTVQTPFDGSKRARSILMRYSIADFSCCWMQQKMILSEVSRVRAVYEGCHSTSNAEHPQRMMLLSETLVASHIFSSTGSFENISRKTERGATLGGL